MEELKVGDRIRHCTRGEGIVIEPPRVFVLYDKDVKDVYGLPSKRFYEPVTQLTKIKSEVRKWKWVIQSKQGCVQVTAKEYSSEEEVEKSLPSYTVLQKIDATERIDDE